MEEKRERKPMGVLGKIAIGYIAVLSVVLLVINVLDRSGYVLIASELNLMGVMLLLFSLLIMLGVWLVRKMKSRMSKMLVGVVAALIVMLGGTYALNQVSVYSALLMPSQIMTVTSPSGVQAVIFRGVDTGYGDPVTEEETKNRMDTRKAYILENHPEEKDTLESEEDYPVGACGWYYTAYPRVAGIFYNKNAEVEGKVFRGVNSAAELHYEWQENGDLHLYLTNPEVGDSGEVVMKP